VPSPQKAKPRARILLVDDEENVRLTIGAILSQRGFAVETAADGREAIERIGREEFDLVLTDLSMTGEDGIAVLAAVRERQPDTIAIMLTGYASLDSAIEAIRRGAYDYLTKPSNLDEMLQTIERGLEKRRLSLEVRRRVAELELLHRVLNVSVDAVLRGTEDLPRALGEVAGFILEAIAPQGAACFLRGESLEPIAEATKSEAAAALLARPETLATAREALRAGRIAVEASGGAALAAPMDIRGRILGAVVVCDREGRAWSDEQRQALATIASRAALAVENSGLFRTLREERETLRMILDAVGDAVIGIDDAGRVVAWNRMAERMTGLEPKAAIGRAIESVCLATPGGDGFAEMKRRAAVTAAGITAGELILRGDKGEDVCADAIYCELRVAGLGHPIRGVLALRDGRERRRSEEQKTNALSQFTHELKTPLTSLLAYAFLMATEKLGPVNDRQLEALRVMRRNGQHLLGLIENMLAISQISQGLVHYRFHETSLGAILADVRETFEPVARERSVALSLDGAAGAVSLAADKEMLTMAVNNLVANALRFTDKGGEVRVAARDAGAEVVLEVHDSGIGIPEEFHARLFQRYFQVDRSRGGSGLGLQIVKSIVDAHGGRIWLESRSGGGAHFFIAMPKKQAEAATTERAPETAAAGA
jgi:PAS domain S-box-containing protein